MKVLASAVLASAFGLAVGQASAAPTLTVTDGTTTITVVDGGGGDACASVGCVSWTGAVGSWTVNILGGFTKPLLGLNVAPHMDLSFNDNYAGPGPGSLTILWSDTDFTTGPAVFLSEIGGTRANGVTSIAYSAFASTSNTLNALTSSLCGGTLTNSPFAGSCSTQFGGGPAYSITQRIILTATGPGQTSGDYGIQVPEPATLALLGIGLLGFGFASRRRA